MSLDEPNWGIGPTMSSVVELVHGHVDQLRALGVIVKVREPTAENGSLAIRVERGATVGDLVVWPNGYVSRLILDGSEFVFEDDGYCGLPALAQIDEFFHRFTTAQSQSQSS
jgi:hypothetical protein